MAYQAIPPISGGGVQMEDVIATATINTTDLTVSGLDGDEDGDYAFTAQIVLVTGTAKNLTLRPFGTDVSTLQSFFRWSNNAGGVASSSDTSWQLGSEDGASEQTVVFTGYMTSKTGRIRQFYSDFNRCRVSTIRDYHSSGYATDTTTNITALTVHCDVADKIKAGSWIKVRKLKSTL